MTIDVVTVSYNRRELLLASCASVVDTDTATRLIVVDNASNDGSAAAVRKAYPSATVLETDTNLGFAAAVNLGIRAGRSPYVLLLNSDATIQANSLSKLIEALNADPDAAAAGPRIVAPSGSLELSLNRTMSFSNELGFKILEILYADGRGPATSWVARQYGRDTNVRSLTAACLLLRREAVEEVGGLDERFFLYAEDVDLCLRLRSAGWRLLFVPKSEAQHVRGASGSANPTQTTLAYRQSQLAFYRKHYGQGAMILLHGFLLVRYLLLSPLPGWRGRRARALLTWCVRDPKPGAP